MKKLPVILLAIGLTCSAAPPSIPTEPPQYKYMYIPFTRIANTFVFGFETTPGYQYEVLSSTNGATWQVYTNFAATEYSYSITTFMDEGPGMQLFRVKYTSPMNCQ